MSKKKHNHQKKRNNYKRKTNHVQSRSGHVQSNASISHTEASASCEFAVSDSSASPETMNEKLETVTVENKADFDDLANDTSSNQSDINYTINSIDRFTALASISSGTTPEAKNSRPASDVEDSQSPSNPKESQSSGNLKGSQSSSNPKGSQTSSATVKSRKPFVFGTTLFFIGTLLYYELIFHGYHFGMQNTNTLRIILFSVVLGGLISIPVGLFPKVINHILVIASTVLLCLLYMTQFVYYSVFHNFLAFFGMLQYTNQAADNFGTAWINMKAHALQIFLLIVPVLVAILLCHRILSLERRSWKQSVLLLAATLLLYIGVVTGMKLTSSKELYSAYEMYRHYTSVDMSIEQLGVLETLLVDTRQGIAGSMGVDDSLSFHAVASGTDGTNSSDDNLDGRNSTNGSDPNRNPSGEGSSSGANGNSSGEDSSNGSSSGNDSTNGGSANENDSDNTSNNNSSEHASTTEEIIDTSPNIIEIDFDAIAAESGSASIASLCEYFKSLPPTNRNEYTGMFEGYNVIQITAEGFSGYALQSGLYPTLSMMAEEGFVFENYYSPLWYGSTLGGEYANTMGSMPQNGGYLSLSHGAAKGNTFLFSLGNQLKSLGYETYAFHNNSYTYYDRNLTHPALGYTWIANGTGLDAQVNEYGTVLWPQSDLVMIEDTVRKYTEKEPFHLYYMTVSGHVIYSFSDNAMSQKNRWLVEDLEYSETTKAYLACQYELECAMEELLRELKELDLYDNTVIILAGDHVPYNNMEVLDEIAGYELEDSFEAYKSTLIIWSGAMEAPIKVDKVCSSIDILPTVSNLLGLEYDSRLIIGQDILSDCEGLVLFANRSFITDRYSYDAAYGRVNVFDGSELSDEALAEKRAFVANKYTAADAITDYNFYKYVLPYKKYASAFTQ